MLRETLYHKELNKTKTISAHTEDELKIKKNVVLQEWNKQWQEEVNKKRIQDLENTVIKKALEQTEKAEEVITNLTNLLEFNSNTKIFSITDGYKSSEYTVEEPKKPDPIFPIQVNKRTIGKKPNRQDSKYVSNQPFGTFFSGKKKNEWVKQKDDEFLNDLNLWETTLKNIESDYIINLEAEKKRVEKENKSIESKFKREVNKWEENKTKFIEEIKLENSKIDQLKKDYLSGKSEVVEMIINNAINSLRLPFNFNIEFETFFDEVTKRALIILLFPNPTDLPNLKKVQYVKSTKTKKDVLMTDNEINKLYEDFTYQLVITIMKLVFQTDSKKKIDFIVLNGYVRTIDKSNGKKIQPTILSVGVKREEFDSINLNDVDAKAWFKKTKGISSQNLSQLVSVAPILSISKVDKRFIESYEVADSLNESINLASMEWQDFENLVREIFEKEFSKNGGEVKITQASRDGGVDAIAFDPDPIKGGKIVIQAKRYTNVVGLSSVRDLYGTLMSEGAMKGILVTTSNYGNDAYQFVKDKPITLLDGSNLLYLLEKYGYKAKIDIDEAKRILKAEESYNNRYKK